MLRPLLKRATSAPPARAPTSSSVAERSEPSSGSARASANTGYADNLQNAKQMATQDPKVVANVVKNWVNNNE